MERIVHHLTSSTHHKQLWSDSEKLDEIVKFASAHIEFDPEACGCLCTQRVSSLGQRKV